jgi:hypothetical protein
VHDQVQGLFFGQPPARSIRMSAAADLREMIHLLQSVSELCGQGPLVQKKAEGK